MKFAANLGFLFAKESSDVLGRYQLAKAVGFQGVELPFPYEIPVEKITEAKKAAGVEQVLINAWPGHMDKGELGIAIFPERREEFKRSLEVSIEYLHGLNCKQLHIMAGKVKPNVDQKELQKTYVENLRYAADRLEKEGVVALIEACNNFWIPDYYMNHSQKAVKTLNEVGHPNLRLQLDLFHSQIIEGNLTHNIKAYLPHVAHIQIAQVPDRGEPDSPGEINYRYVFNLLEELGYKGWIGLEYHPRGGTVDGLKWMKNWGYSDYVYKN